MKTHTPAPASRQAYLDHIRIFLTVMVILLHTAITYGASGGWYCTDVDPGSVSPFMEAVYMLFNTVTQAYSMGFFFIIAGYFTASSLKRKGAADFLKSRFIRLGIPLVLFSLIVAPVTIGLARLLVEGGTLLDGFHWVWVQHHYECGPMWFVQALLIFSLIYVGWKALFPDREDANESAPLPSHLSLLIAAVFVGLLAFTLRLWVPVGKNILCMQLGYFASYIVLFYCGCRAAKYRWLERITPGYALPWAVVSLLTIISLPVIAASCDDGSKFIGGANIFAFSYAMWEPFAAWGILLGMLYASRRFLPRTTPFISRLARCSFAVYFIHPVVLVSLTLLAHPWQAAPGVKWLVVGSAACVGSWLAAAVIVKLPGLRKVF